MSERLIMHVDMDAFYASVEQLDHEDYRGRPVIVAGLGKRSVVSTCSYEARTFGVHSAMPTAKAMQLCPQGIFVEGNFPRYAEVSKAIFQIFESYSPLIEPLSIDEAFLDLTGMERLMESPAQYARQLKNEIRQKTGIVASAGIAPNKFLAKLASDLEKPDGLTIIAPNRIQETLDPLPVKKIWGVGTKTNTLLAGIGVHTIRQLRQTKYSLLENILGRNMAAHLMELAQGRDNRPVAPRENAKSISNEVTFGEDIQGKEAARQILLELSVKVGRRLRHAGFKAKTIQLKLRKNDFTTYTRQRRLFEMSNFDNDIYRTVNELFSELGIFYGIRLLGVTASGFDEEDELSLFTQNTHKKEKLYSTIDSINKKFGALGITRANLLPRSSAPPADHLPAGQVFQSLSAGILKNSAAEPALPPEELLPEQADN
ncbi:MAG: DNA polymerase IV [Anaerovibrio sp.]|nr:DNA polymerase IV [Anaerovibrio sp.]